MRKKINTLIDKIKYTDLEFLSFALLCLWMIAPIIEYIIKNFIQYESDFYFIRIRYIVGVIGILEYIIYFSKKKRNHELEIKRFIPHILILILLVISIISTIFSKNSLLSLLGEANRKEGLIGYIMYIGFILSASIITNQKYIKILFKTLIFSALFITILPLFNSDFTYKYYANIYKQFNHYGYFLMISSILSGLMFIESIKVKKIIYLLIFIFLSYMLIRNDTFGSYLALLISLLFAFIYSLVVKHKRLNMTILTITFILASFLISHFDIKIGERKDLNSSQEIVSNNFTILFLI